MGPYLALAFGNTVFLALFYLLNYGYSIISSYELSILATIKSFLDSSFTNTIGLASVSVLERFVGGIEETSYMLSIISSASSF